DGVDDAALKRGIAYLDEAARPGSPYATRLTLTDGQAIVFDNTRISHGRTPYRDSASRRRCMYRGLYLGQPRIDVGAPGLPAAGE
ncbi:TauD/TfdA family dioxygenase, partial [Streptomyces sp. NPDC058459]|uniref:TauD/TfdA family dioxygenase n=1 Tax=Streptomyces sp. NPDC058459 TaxID=3346508 RepID=UPI0036539FA7